MRRPPQEEAQAFPRWRRKEQAGKMTQGEALKLANALADLTPEEQNSVVAIADALRIRGGAAAPKKQGWRAKAKAKAAAGEGPKRMGRPKGSKNKPKDVAVAEPETQTEATH